MDPITLAIAGAVATGVATGAGQGVGTALGTLLGRVRERFQGREEQLQTVETAATALDSEFSEDPTFHQECRDLWSQAQGMVSNSFSGMARNVIQTRDVHGDLTIN
ncbi:hypothetical protein GCM10022221_65730 [Actinocorallia aurea]